MRAGALESLKIRHEEELIFSVEQFGNRDGTAQGEAILIPAERRFGGGRADEIVRFRVQIAVAEELEGGSVIAVGPGFGGDVDLARLPAELVGVNAALHL